MIKYEICEVTENKWFKSFTNNELDDTEFIDRLKKSKYLNVIAQCNDSDSVGVYGSANGYGLYNFLSDKNQFIRLCNGIKLKVVNDVRFILLNDEQPLTDFTSILNRFLEEQGIKDINVKILYYEECLKNKLGQDE